jgi:hypothetical protein
MNDVVARFEFRAFAQDFGMVTDKLRRGSESPDITESRETYFVSSAAQHDNVKVRSGALEIKRLVSQSRRLQQWKPVVREPFPLDVDKIAEPLLVSLGCPATPPQDAAASYTLGDLIENVFRPDPRLAAVAVFKRRLRLHALECEAEIDDVLINGAAIRSVAMESADEDSLCRAVEHFGLNDYENVSYPLAIARLLSLQPLGRDAWYVDPDSGLA